MEGSATTKNAYDEYGVPGAGNLGRFQYTGQMWLGEVGLYHYKARAYAPELGRFLQPDPIGYADGMNLYAYVKNDPINHVDPRGTLCYEIWLDYFITYSNGNMGTITKPYGIECYEDANGQVHATFGEIGSLNLTEELRLSYEKTAEYNRCPTVIGDFFVATGTLAAPSGVGVSYSHIVDKYGRSYTSLGLTYGATFPGGFLMFFEMPFQDDSPQGIYNFVTGFAHSVSGGAGVGAGISWNNAGWAVGAGATSPGVSYTQSGTSMGSPVQRWANHQLCRAYH